MPVLSKMWLLEEVLAMDISPKFCDVSLAKLESHSMPSKSGEVRGILVHDLLLDFCRRQAEAGKKLRYWRMQLPNSFLNTSSGRGHEGLNADVAVVIVKMVPRPWWRKAVLPEDGYIHENLVRIVPRPWWIKIAVPEDGCIHENLARHLSWPNHGAELGALLLDA